MDSRTVPSSHSDVRASGLQFSGRIKPVCEGDSLCNASSSPFLSLLWFLSSDFMHYLPRFLTAADYQRLWSCHHAALVSRVSLLGVSIAFGVRRFGNHPKDRKAKASAIK